MPVFLELLSNKTKHGKKQRKFWTFSYLGLFSLCFSSYSYWLWPAAEPSFQILHLNVSSWMIFPQLLRSPKNRNQWTGTFTKCTGREFWSEDNHNAIPILGGGKIIFSCRSHAAACNSACKSPNCWVFDLMKT